MIAMGNKQHAWGGISKEIGGHEQRQYPSAVMATSMPQALSTWQPSMVMLLLVAQDNILRALLVSMLASC